MELLIFAVGALVVFLLCYLVIFAKIASTFVRFILSVVVTALAAWGALLYMGKDVRDLFRGDDSGVIQTLHGDSTPAPPPVQKRQMRMTTIGG